jgi:hypothetical protein
VTEGTFESVSTGPGEVAETATDGDVDEVGAGVLSPTAGLTDESFAVVVDVELKSWVETGTGDFPLEVVDGTVAEPKSWFETGTGDSSLEVVDGTLVEPKSWVETGAGEVVGFASEEESRPGSKLPLGGEAGSA